ncbi:MAG: ankyrin repeat domain-containing protein [Rickettsiales bacterium]|jgi:hypothetical protein|nr:ankyrin repeat domain-containing protein [Rickettsiales bacterium]
MEYMLRLFLVFLFLLPIVVAEGGATDVETKRDAAAKSKVLEEFRNKLLNEEEVKRELEKQKILTEEDFDALREEKTSRDILENRNELMDALNEGILDRALIEEENEEKKEEKRREAEEKKKKEEEEKKRIAEEKFMTETEKKQREAERKKQREEEAKQKKLDEQKKKEEKKRRQDEEEKQKKLAKLSKEKQADVEKQLENEMLENDQSERALAEKGKISLSAEIGEGNKTGSTSGSAIDEGIAMKEYNITDTGVSVEYLYSADYQNLVNNKTSIKKSDVSLETDIPKVLTLSNQLRNFSTSDIPAEILSYNRSAENRHIPTIMRADDLFSVSKQAIFENNIALLRSVVEKTQDPDFLVDNRYSLLSLAVKNQRYELIKYLIFNGASINKQDSMGNSALHDAILTFNGNIMKFLVVNGSDMDLQNSDGDTPLMLAIRTSQNDAALYLIKMGANLHLKNKDGLNILNLAERNKNRNLHQIIIGVMAEEKKKMGEAESL